MLAKFISETKILPYNGKYIRTAGHVIANPGIYDLMNAGYMEVVEAASPSLKEGETATAKYTVTDGKIYQYHAVDAP